MAWKSLMALGFVAVVAIGVKLAMDTGQKSPIYAMGTLEISDELAASAQGIDTLFMVLYDQDSAMPMPYGAVKFHLDQPAKPGRFFDFVITKEKLQLMGMAGQGALPRNMRIKARLDRDGQGGRDQAGDITGEVAPVVFGSQNVVIKMSTKI